jgi:predicted RNA-binding protein with RPS1 domain
MISVEKRSKTSRSIAETETEIWAIIVEKVKETGPVNPKLGFQTFFSMFNSWMESHNSTSLKSCHPPN